MQEKKRKKIRKSRVLIFWVRKCERENNETSF